MKSIGLVLLVLACSVEAAPRGATVINVRGGECLLVYRYDSHETFTVDGVERQEHCLALGPGPVSIERASVAIDQGECACE